MATVKCINCHKVDKVGNMTGFKGIYRCGECNARLISAHFNRYYNNLDPSEGRKAITEDNRIVDMASGEVLAIDDAVTMLKTDMGRG